MDDVGKLKYNIAYSPNRLLNKENKPNLANTKSKFENSIEDK